MSSDATHNSNGSVRELFVLGMISSKPMYGHELMQVMAISHADAWVEISEKHVYHVVRKLERQGLVTGEQEAAGRRPPRRRFTITPAGRLAFRAMCADDRHLDALAYCAFDTVIAMLATGDVETSFAFDILARRRERLAARLAEADQTVAGMDIEAAFGRVPRWMFEKARRLLATELQWLDELMAEAKGVGWPAMRVHTLSYETHPSAVDAPGARRPAVVQPPTGRGSRATVARRPTGGPHLPGRGGGR